MPKIKDLVPCPQCGELAELPRAAWRRNTNLTMACAGCGHVHLALNAIRLAAYHAMTARGFHPGMPPPKPLPIEPVQVFPQPDGKTEIVFKRDKKGGETSFTRKIKPRPDDMI